MNPAPPVTRSFIPHALRRRGRPAAARARRESCAGCLTRGRRSLEPADGARLRSGGRRQTLLRALVVDASNPVRPAAYGLAARELRRAAAPDGTRAGRGAARGAREG